MIRRYLPRSTEELVRWYERYVSPLSLIAGFLADNFILLRRVDLLRSNLLLFSYLLISALGIILFNMIVGGKLRRPWLVKTAPFILIVIQFCFGGLFSGYLSLYSRSAGYAVSWIFVLAVAALLLGNERFIRFYDRFIFQIGIYFTVLFSFLIFFLPVVLKKIGPLMFILSGAISLAVITLFLILLRKLVPEIVREERVKVPTTVIVIYLLFNALYFLNVIPPLPLSLKDAGIYHGITRVGAQYRVDAEPVPWYEAYRSYNPVFHHAGDESAYAYSAVFAPSGLATTIVHEWQRYDTVSRKWQTTDTLSFPINGGRDGGYRGYSVKSGLTAGKWRVNVLTQYGQTIGRISFTVVESSTSVPTIGRFY